MSREPRRPTRRLWFFVLLAVTAGHAAWTSSGLVYPDLARDYPHQDADSCEWLSNGLHRAGYPTRDTVRPPLYPWLLAVAERMAILEWIPVFGQLVMVAGALLLFTLLARRPSGSEGAARADRSADPSAVAAAVAASFFLGQRFQSLGLDLMADHLAAVLLFACLTLYALARQRPWLYVPAGLAGGLSAVTQQAALLLPGPVALDLWLHRRRDLRSPWLMAGAVVFALPAVGWFASKALTYGRFGDVTTQHWGLLGWSGEGPAYYAGASLRVFGWVACVLACAGAWRVMSAAVKGRAYGRRSFVFLAVTATILGFFAFAYRWHAERFLLYVYLPVGVLVAQAVRSLRPGARAASLVLLVASMAWPWRPTIDQSLAASAQHRVRETRKAFESPSASPMPRLDGVHHAVFLHAEGRPWVDRYRISCRLGNVLRRRVSYVPASWWLPGVSMDDASAEAPVLGYRALRLRPSASESEGLLLVLDRGLPAVRAAELAAGGSAPMASAAAWDDALRLRDALPFADSMVVLFPCSAADELESNRRDLAARALALTVGTPSLFVATGEERVGLRRLIDEGSQGEWSQLGSISLREIAAGGWRAWEVSTCR